MRKFIKVTLYMAELLADVRVKAYFTGKNLTDDSRKQAYVQELDDESNVDLVLRSFSNALGKASAVISEYAPVELEESSDVLLTATNDIIMVISMPQNYNEGMTNALAQILHDYLVNCALVDWYIQTMPQGSSTAGTYNELANGNIIQLRNALTRRQRPARTDIVPDVIPYSGAGTFNEKSAATISFSVNIVAIQTGNTTTNTATTNSTGAVTYTSSDTTIATVDASTGTVTGVAAGSATITATVAETDEFNSATATYSLNVRTAQEEGDQ